jgi:hypothetical protein
VIPMDINPDVPHRSDYSCCQAVQDAVGSAALEGDRFDAEWIQTLHDLAMGHVTADELIDQIFRDRWRDDGGAVGIVDY